MATAENEKDSYVFNRNYLSSIRLNYMHFWTRKLCGYLIHPLIPQGSTELRVADVGTGTGIWATEAACEIPHSAIIDGFDVSAAQYPHHKWLPKNVHLQVHDAFAPFPPDRIGIYDIVQLRYFFTLLDPKNVQGLVENLMTLLKPGGYLQWLDLDGPSCRAAVSSPSAPSAATEKVAAFMRKPQPDSDFSWIPNVPEIAKNAGLQLLTHEIIPMKDEVRPLWSLGTILGVEEGASKSGGPRADETRSTIETMQEEIGQGTSIDANFFCMIARKPL